MSASEIEQSEINPFHLSANKKKPSLVDGFFLLLRGIILDYIP
jgi:hypothetical protein